jgi:hypothetical protein
MGIAYRCDPTTRIGIEVWHGNVGLDVARLHVEQLAKDPDWTASRRIITDLTGLAQESRPSPEQIRRLSDAFLQQLAYLVTDAKWSIVADRAFAEALVFGEQVRHEVRRMIVFTNLVSACVWLGIDRAEVEPVIKELRREIRAEPADREGPSPR